MIEAFYVYLAITGLALLLGLFMVTMDFGHFDIDHDFGGHDHDVGHHHHGPSPLSPIFIMAFMVFYGVTGMILENTTDLGGGLIAGLSVLGGLPFYFLSWKGFSKFAGDTHGQIEEHGVVGFKGSCTIKIAEESMGEVVIITTSGPQTYAARSSGVVKVGQAVTVLEDLGTHLVVG